MSISNAIGVISGINECANLFQWTRSAISSLRSRWSGTQEQNPQVEVLHLQSGLQCLSDILPAMYNLVDRAEWRSHGRCVAELLPKFKDAVYDADDLLDEFRWYERKVAVEGNASPYPFIDFFKTVMQGSFNKVKDIQKRLDILSNQLEKMGLPEAIPRFDKSVRPETSSFPAEAKIFGRDKELRQLLKLLGASANTSSRRDHLKRKRASYEVNVAEMTSTTINQVHSEPKNLQGFAVLSTCETGLLGPGCLDSRLSPSFMHSRRPRDLCQELQCCLVLQA
uniref:Rx N-terminal domain-containing protein n=1 Tax=Aegilops tauschii TaxID=37682 RepID=R7WF73_AEGTA